MNQMRASHPLYDYPMLEETEFALAISPCPQIERPKDGGESAQSTHRRGVSQRQAPAARGKRPGGRDFTDALTIGWAIAFAVAVALAVHAAGF